MPQEVETSDRYRWLVESIRDYSIIMLDQAGRIINWSPGAEQMFGYRATQVIGQLGSLFYLPEEMSKGELEVALLRAEAEGHAVDERWHIRRDGSRFWAISHITPVLSDTHQFQGFTKVIRDGTALRRVQDTLRQNQQQYWSLVNSLHGIVWEAQVGTHQFTLVSKQAETWFGYPVEEWLTEPDFWKTHLHPDDQLWAPAFCNEAADEKRPYQFEYRLMAADGQVVWIRDVVSVIVENDQPAWMRGIMIDITLQKQAEEVTHRSEAHFRALIENASDLITILNEDGTIRYESPALKRVLGYEATELIGLHILAHVHPDDVALVIDTFINRVHGQPIFPPIEFRFQHQDGSWLMLEAVGNNLLEDPIVAGIVINSRDITKRKQVEEALYQSENQLHAILTSLTDIVWSASVETGEMLYLSAAASSLYGRPVADFFHLPKLWLEVVHPEDKAPVACFAQMVREHGEAEMEYRIVRPDGALRWLCNKARVSLNEHGQPVRMDGIATDITERKLSEQALRESEARYQHIAANLPGMVYQLVLHPDGTVEFPFISEGCRDLYGLEPHVIQQHPSVILDLIDPEDRLTSDSSMAESARTMLPWKWKGQVALLSGERKWLQGAARPEKQPNGDIIWDGLLLDITERKSLEEQLRQAQKIEAVGHLVAGIAHDFNNLLTAIIGYSDLMLRQLDDPRQLHRVEEIKKAGKRAAALTHQLLTFSRKQILQTKVLDLNATIVDLDKLLQRLIGEDIQLVTLLDQTIGRVRADSGQISQVVMNLVVNARDAMPQGGKLTIETANRYLDKGEPSTLGGVIPGPYIMLAVSDTGIGMDARTQERIFEPYFTTKEVGEGTGLGLSTVHSIVKQSGGDIRVESRPGQGTTFKIYLPCVQEGLEAKEELSEEAPGIPGGTEKVLLVEDDEMVRSLTRQVLEIYGYEVLEATNGARAMAICEEQDRDIDLLITDVVMPEMSGSELAKRLSSTRPRLCVLYMSGYTEKTMVQHGVVSDDLHFIQKPFSPESMARKVRELLDAADELKRPASQSLR